MSRKKTHEEFVNEVFDIVGEEYSVFGIYTNTSTKLEMNHNLCNHTWLITPNNFLRGKRCPKCSNQKIGISQRKSNLEFINEVYTLVGNEYSVIEKYITSQTKILIKHNICEQEYKVAPIKFLMGRRCPLCSESKGEQRIRRWLEEHDFPFDSQMEFDELKGLGGGNLSYDFYLSEQNILIEYQGVFHDGSGDDFTKVNLETQQEHDRRKKEYALINNINLLEIWYWDFENVEEILQEELIK